MISPHGALCVLEDRCRKELSDPHQTGPVHLHYLVVHLDPGERQEREMFQNNSGVVIREASVSWETPHRMRLPGKPTV